MRKRRTNNFMKDMDRSLKSVETGLPKSGTFVNSHKGFLEGWSIMGL